MFRNITFIAVLLLPSLLMAQQKSDLQQVLERLDRIEQENKNLADEVRALRAELAASRGIAAEAPTTATASATLQERV